MSQNHVIDPTFFYDAIEEFSFNFTIYTLTGKTVDSYGQTKSTYSTRTIRGSLQSQGKTLHKSLEGNTTTTSYNFYCKSLYRIDIGDIIAYKNNYLRVISVQDFDEYGCRSCALEQVQITAYRDLAAYIKYLNGEEFV